MTLVFSPQVRFLGATSSTPDLAWHIASLQETVVNRTALCTQAQGIPPTKRRALNSAMCDQSRRPSWWEEVSWCPQLELPGVTDMGSAMGNVRESP